MSGEFLVPTIKGPSYAGAAPIARIPVGVVVERAFSAVKREVR